MSTNNKDEHKAITEVVDSVVPWEECECRRPERGDQYCPRCIGNFFVVMEGIDTSCQTCGGVGCIEKEEDGYVNTHICPACFPGGLGEARDEQPPAPVPGEDVERTNRARAVFRAYPATANEEMSLVAFLGDVIYFCQVRGYDFDGALSDARSLLEKDGGKEKRIPKCSRCDDLLVLQNEAEDGTIIESLCVCHVL